MNRATPTHTRRRTRLVRASLATVGAAALVLAAPLAANAHVGVTPDQVDAEQYTVLSFAFSHGCGESPTTALDIEIPEGVLSVAPTVQAGWQVEVERDANDSARRVVFTPDTPIGHGLRGEVSMSARFDASLADSDVAFPVVQRCVEGVNEWTQLAAEGQNPHDLDSPAPVVAVGPAAAEGDEHGADHSAEHGTASGADDAAAAGGSGTAGVVLGAIGAVLGGAALVLTLVRGRRSAS